MIIQFKLYESLENDYFLKDPKIIYYHNIGGKEKWIKKAYARIENVQSTKYYKHYNEHVIGTFRRILNKIINNIDNATDFDLYKEPCCLVEVNETEYFILILDEHIEFSIEINDYVTEGEMLYTRDIKKLADEAKELILITKESKRFGL